MPRTTVGQVLSKACEDEPEKPPEPLHPDFEPSFLKNTITFASNLRVNAALALQTRYKASQDPMERRLLFLAIHQQMCMAMEDLGAHLYAYREKKSGRDYMTALVNYGGSSAYLCELFDGKDQKQIAEEFGFSEEVPPFLKKNGYTNELRTQAAKNFYAHFETVANQQKHRLDVCNKLKHGATVYLPESKDQLGVVLRKLKKPEPWRLSYNQSELKTFLYVIVTCSHQTKEIAFQYLAAYHPATAQTVLEWEHASKDIRKSLLLLKQLEHVSRKPAKSKTKRSKTNKK